MSMAFIVEILVTVLLTVGLKMIFIGNFLVFIFTKTWRYKISGILYCTLVGLFLLLLGYLLALSWGIPLV